MHTCLHMFNSLSLEMILHLALYSQVLGICSQKQIMLIYLDTLFQLEPSRPHTFTMHVLPEAQAVPFFGSARNFQIGVSMRCSRRARRHPQIHDRND
jgi:hypothetical protein